MFSGGGSHRKSLFLNETLFKYKKLHCVAKEKGLMKRLLERHLPYC